MTTKRKQKNSNNNCKSKKKVETLSNKYVDLNQQYHQLKDTAHEETLTLDRLKNKKHI